MKEKIEIRASMVFFKCLPLIFRVPVSLWLTLFFLFWVLLMFRGILMTPQIFPHFFSQDYFSTLFFLQGVLVTARITGRRSACPRVWTTSATPRCTMVPSARSTSRVPWRSRLTDVASISGTPKWRRSLSNRWKRTARRKGSNSGLSSIFTK